MKHHKAFEMVNSIAPKGSFVSVEKQIYKDRTGEICTEWNLYVTNDNCESANASSESFKKAYSRLSGMLAEWEDGE